MYIEEMKGRAHDLGGQLTDDVHEGLVALGKQHQWSGVAGVLRGLASKVAVAGIRFASFAGVSMRQHKRAEAQREEQSTDTDDEL